MTVSSSSSPSETLLATVPLKTQLEALLFLSSKPLPALELSELLSASIRDTEQALLELIQDYAGRESTAFEIDDADEGYMLQVREELQPLVEKVLPASLSSSTLKTLSTIALKAPVLQKEIIDRRGSTAYDAIQELLKQNLVAKKRSGRSYLLTLTPKFHQLFKLSANKNDLQFLLDQ